MLFRYGSRFSKDKEFIKDCIQDVFLYLWKHRSSLRADVTIKPYLMVSLRRHMHRNVPNAAFLDEFTEDKAESFNLTFSVEEPYIQQETTAKRVQRMKQLLEKLPRRQKEVIYLKFFHAELNFFANFPAGARKDATFATTYKKPMARFLPGNNWPKSTRITKNGLSMPITRYLPGNHHFRSR